MLFRHSQITNRIAAKVELYEHRWVVPLHPPIVPRFNGHHLRCAELKNAAVREFHVNLAARQEPDMRVHAEVGTYRGFHVLRPPKSDRINHPLHPAVRSEEHTSEL